MARSRTVKPVASSRPAKSARRPTAKPAAAPASAPAATRADGAAAARPKLEGEVFYPSPEVVAQARVKDWDAVARRAGEDLEGFWAAEAEELEWYRKWDKVLDDSNKPFFKWFKGAQTNIVHNCLDRHQQHLAQEQALAGVGGREGRGPDLLVLRAQPRRLASSRTS